MPLDLLVPEPRQAKESEASPSGTTPADRARWTWSRRLSSGRGRTSLDRRSDVRHPRPAPTQLRDSALLALAITIIAIVVKLVWRRFTWWGDNAESFFPLWHQMGLSLRSGHWLAFDPTGFAGSDIVGESAYGVFNPVTLGNAVLVSLTDQLSRASFAVVVEFLVLLGIGVALTARAYGSRRLAAFIAGLIVPFGGFTLFWDGGNWISGLMSLTWVVWTWWAGVRYARGRTGPLGLVVFGALAVTVGSPYALLGVSVVLLSLAVELAVTRDLRRLAGLVVAGGCLIGVVLLVYLPLVNALPVTYRAAAKNGDPSGYLAPGPLDLLGLSQPSLLPQFKAWTADHDAVPSVYLSWAVAPLLPWLRYRAAWAGQWRARTSLLVLTVVFFGLTTGPDHLWLFRWPLRLVEFLWVGLAVALAVTLSRGLAVDHRARRSAVSAAVVLAGSVVAWLGAPDSWRTHAVVAVLMAVLVAAMLLAGTRHGLTGVAVVVTIGTALVVSVQAAAFRWDGQSVAHDQDLGRISDLGALRAATQTYRGTVLQLSNVAYVTDPEALRSGRLTFGNLLWASGHPTLNRYSGLSFYSFQRGMSMDYHGSVTTDATADLMYAETPGYHTLVIDSLGVDTLVVGRQGAKPQDLLPRDGWSVVLQDADRTVLRRATEQLEPAVTPSTGIVVTRAEADGATVDLSLSAPRGGTVLLDRLAWPGYRAVTSTGAAVRVDQGPLGLMRLNVPPGANSIRVTYEIPGAQVGWCSVLLTALLAAAHQWAWTRRRRRSDALLEAELVALTSEDAGDSGFPPVAHEFSPGTVEAPIRPLVPTYRTPDILLPEPRDHGVDHVLSNRP